MAFSVDTSLNFSSSTGYTLSNMQISSGVLTLTSLATSGTCETPDVDVSTWASTQRVQLTYTVALGATILALVSFDSGDTWFRYDNGLWRSVEEASIATNGMTIDELENVRTWLEAEETLRFKFYFARPTTTPNPSIDLISIYYKTNTTFEVFSVPAEPSPTETLEAALGLQPEYPIQMQYRFPLSTSTFGHSYTQAIAQDTTMRRVYTGEFQASSDTERSDIIDFLNSHISVPFTWEKCPLTSSTTKKFYTKGVDTERYDQVVITRIPFEFVEAK